MKTGNTLRQGRWKSPKAHASMEPGHEDREYKSDRVPTIRAGGAPQRSPVMKTGNTLRQGRWKSPKAHASMEPGHEDREYLDAE